MYIDIYHSYMNIVLICLTLKICVMKTSVAIQNLKCGGCENTIVKKLHALKGITDISVNISDSILSFSYETKNGLETVKKELSRLGYPIEGYKNTLDKKAKSYISCAIGRINK